MAFERDEDEIGSLWEKQSAKGTVYLTGTIAGQPIVAFRNPKATPENRQPTWRVKKAQPREQRQ